MLTSCNTQGVTSHVTDSGPQVQMVDITFKGGSGKAHIESPVTVTTKDGRMYATLVWSSENYD